MKRLKIILASVLVLQILLTIILMTRKQDIGAFQSEEKLIALDLKNLDNILIEEDPSRSLLLSNQNEQWIMPEYFDSPVSEAKLSTLTGMLFNIHKAWPVASSDSAAPRFKVTDKDYERKVSFRKGTDPLTILYLGTSPGFKKIHARVDKENEIYAIDFSAFELSTQADDWLDKHLLKLNQDDLTQIKTMDYTLNKSGLVWALDNIQEDQELNIDEVDALLRLLSNPGYAGILGIENNAEFGLDAPVLAISIKTLRGENIKFQYAKPKNQDYYVLKSTTQPYYFKVNPYQVEPILKINAEALVKAKTDQAQTEDHHAPTTNTQVE